MDYIKNLFLSQFKTLALVSISMLFSVFLLMIRIKLIHSFFFLFLVWNLFLAVIPFAISTYLKRIPKLNTFWFILWFGVWLLFLPNAPYIITDFLHLKVSSNHLMWLDILVIGAFALSGLLLFLFSLIDMEKLLYKFLKKTFIKLLITAVLFLSAFGVYLGRFLRYNSWEIIQNPSTLFTDIFEILMEPSKHGEAWLFTLIFGAFLSLAYWMFKQLDNEGV